MEWAPENSIKEKQLIRVREREEEAITKNEKTLNVNSVNTINRENENEKIETGSNDNREENKSNATLFVKNLNFKTSEDALREVAH